jgi:hypothetical protein
LTLAVAKESRLERIQPGKGVGDFEETAMCFTLFYGKEKAAKEHRKDAAPTMTEHKSPADSSSSPMTKPAEAGLPTKEGTTSHEEVTPA